MACLLDEPAQQTAWPTISRASPCLQLAGSVFRLLDFEPLADVTGSGADPSTAGEVLGAGQPGRLCLNGLRSLENAPALGGGSAPDSKLSALLEAALPLGATLRQLMLFDCRLEAASLQWLPVLAGLQRLVVKICRSSDGLDAVLQALVRRAPALTSLQFEAYRELRCWPSYLLAPPCLQSVAVLNHALAGWDEEEAPVLIAAAARPGEKRRCCL